MTWVHDLNWGFLGKRVHDLKWFMSHSTTNRPGGMFSGSSEGAPLPYPHTSRASHHSSSALHQLAQVRDINNLDIMTPITLDDTIGAINAD